MPKPDSLLSSLTAMIDRVVPDQAARAAARRELAGLADSPEIERLLTRLAAILAQSGTRDRWTSRARPGFLYVMYAMILWALPLGVIGAVSPHTASAIAGGMTAYLTGLPEPLYALFGTGYLGYAAMRQWGKVAGSDT